MEFVKYNRDRTEHAPEHWTKWEQDLTRLVQDFHERELVQEAGKVSLLLNDELTGGKTMKEGARYSGIECCCSHEVDAGRWLGRFYKTHHASPWYECVVGCVVYDDRSLVAIVARR